MLHGLITGGVVAGGLMLVGNSLPSPLPQAKQSPAQTLPGSLAGNAGPATPGSDLSPNVQGLGPGIIAIIRIPRIGLQAPVRDRGLDAHGRMVVAGGFGVTHFLNSAAIGKGNAVLYGHDDIEGSVFKRLDELQPDDLITVSLGDGSTQTYRVVSRAIVSATAVQILDPTVDVRLTLFTCWPTYVDNRRIVVTAALSPVQATERSAPLIAPSVN